MRSYILALKAHPWLLPAVEEALSSLPSIAGADVSHSLRKLRAQNGRPISDDELLIALNALCELGVLTRRGPQFIFDKDLLATTADLRRGIRGALDVLNETPKHDTRNIYICASLPPTLSPAAEHVIRESSTDLRSGLLDVIASARQSLIIASPFWDAGTTAEVVVLVSKKLAAGVQVSLLGRFSRDLPAPVRSQFTKISHDSNCAVLSWFAGTGNETETFHFKAISADRGQRAYLGSANMTTSSLRSRMELGIILSGEAASQLDRILRVVLTMASPINPAVDLN